MKAARQDNYNTITYFKRHMGFALARYILPFVSLFLGIKLFMDHAGHGLIFGFGHTQIFAPISLLLIYLGLSRLLKNLRTI